MSKELRDKAELIMKELKESLAPLREELQSLRNDAKDSRIAPQ